MPNTTEGCWTPVTAGGVDRRSSSAKPSKTMPLSDDAELLADIVSNSRKWYVLRTLVTTDGPVRVDELAQGLAKQTELSGELLSGTLHQTTLQSLDEDGVIHYNSEDELVRLNDRFFNLVSAKDELIAEIETIDSTGGVGSRQRSRDDT